MRTFEIMLILVNLATMFLHFRQQSKSVWRWSAVTNFAMLVLHGMVEGLRYQMAISYVFVILLVIITTIKMDQKFASKTPNLLKRITIGLSFILLAFTVFLYALPVFKLPKPAGSYAVGIQYLHLIDDKRIDPFLDGSTQKRDLNLVKTHSKENLAISGAQRNYPVILFSHGAGTTMEVQTSQSEDLASHGYIVVAIDHTYVSAATVFPDRVVSHREATTNFDVPEPAEPITQIMADDASFVIDELEKMDNGRTESIFQGKLDLEEIGVMGHSVGGAVAYHLAINDSRIEAAIDIDGAVYVTPEGNEEEVASFLMLANDKYHIQGLENRAPLLKRFVDMDEIDQKITVDIYGSREAYQDAYNKAQQNVIGLTEVLKANGNLYTIEGSDHMKFTDIGLFIAIPQLRELIGISGKTNPVRCLDITKRLSLAFFDLHLKGKSPDSIQSLLREYPELKRIDL